MVANEIFFYSRYDEKLMTALGIEFCYNLQ